MDCYFWSPENNPPKDLEEALDRMGKADIEGGFFWGLSPTAWKDHSRFVSRIIGKKVTLEEGGVKTDWRENLRAARGQLRGE